MERTRGHFHCAIPMCLNGSDKCCRVCRQSRRPYDVSTRRPGPSAYVYRNENLNLNAVGIVCRARTRQRQADSR